MNYFVFNPVWVGFTGCMGILWLYLVVWVSADARGVGENQTLWNALFYSVGALCALLTWAFPLLVVSFPVLFISLISVYAPIRNKRVPAEQKLFGKEHLHNSMVNILGKFGVRMAKKIPKMEEGEGGREIVLATRDGTPLEAAAPGRRVKGSVQSNEAIAACKQIIQEAVDNRGTDIHLEPKGGTLQVRYRIDGVLHNAEPLPEDLALTVVSAIKVLSEMDIAEKRRSQDGHFTAMYEGREIDFRVATSTSLYGETMAIRILDRARGLMRLQDLGMSPRVLQTLEALGRSSSGMLIAAGPTGSGKTTTLYAALAEVDAFRQNIITIEEPVEYKLDNVTQVPINTKAGITYANTLKSIMRQDPDVIMVGEIRDAETVRIAMQASLTGHFVLTTLHANNSTTSMFRLVDLGIEAHLIASSVKAVISQRLVRVLCDKCRAPYRPSPDLLRRLGLSQGKVEVLYKAKGCEHCQGTGYRGRTGIFELLAVNEAVGELLRQHVSLQQFRAEARKTGLRTLEEDGIRKAIQGITSLKEVARVTS